MRILNWGSDPLPAATLTAESGIAEMLRNLEQLGTVNLRYLHEKDYSSIHGWQVGIDLKVAHAGAVFKIESEYKHKSAEEAVKQLWDRVHNTINAKVMDPAAKSP